MSEQEKIIYAPVLIPTLCRDVHFMRAIESLKLNLWAKHTDIYIALDFPKEEKHFDGYKKICDYLESSDFSCFNSFNIIRRHENIGAFFNMKLLIDEIKGKYDRWILAEDDLEFSPNFLEYMDRCLAEFEDDNSVLGVSGYSFPLEYYVKPDSTVIKQSAMFCVWGTGYWRDKYLYVEKNLEEGFLFNEFDKSINSKMIKKLEKNPFCDYIDSFVCYKGENRFFKMMTDISLSIYMGLKDKYQIMPVESKVRNHGYDGSGSCCEKITNYTNEHSLAYSYETQFIDIMSNFEVVLDTEENCAKNKKILGEYMYVPGKRLQKARMLFCLCSVFGTRLTCFLYDFLKKCKQVLKK